MLLLPFQIVKFWFYEAPQGIISYFASLNLAFLQIFSLPILIKTYFKPWKNEYRKDLVVFSIGMGMFVKTFVILADLFMLLFLLSLEFFIILGFIFFPLISLALFLKII